MISGLQTELVHQDQYLHIALNKELGLIATRWQQHPSSEEFRRAMTLSADYVCAEKCRYWLSDARKMHYMELADQNWLVNILIPRIAPYLERFARIMTEEGLTMLDIQRISHRKRRAAQRLCRDTG